MKGKSTYKPCQSINSRKRSIATIAKTSGIAVIEPGVTGLATPNDNVVVRVFVFRKKEKMRRIWKKTQQIKKFVREEDSESLPL